MTTKHKIKKQPGYGLFFLLVLGLTLGPAIFPAYAQSPSISPSDTPRPCETPQMGVEQFACKNLPGVPDASSEVEDFLNRVASSKVQILVEMPKLSYTPGENVTFPLWLDNQADIPLLFGNLVWESQVYHVNTDLIDASAVEIDLLNNTVKGAEFRYIHGHRVTTTREAFWNVPSGSTCPMPEDDQGWDQRYQTDEPVPSGLYLYTISLAQTPNNLFIGGYRLFNVRFDAASQPVAPSLSELGQPCFVTSEGPGSLDYFGSQIPYVFDGFRWKFDALPIHWRYNRTYLGVVVEKSLMTPAAAETAIRNAMEEGPWETDPGSYLSFVYDGYTSDVPWLTISDSKDGRNTVGWTKFQDPATLAVVGCWKVVDPFPRIPECDMGISVEKPMAAPTPSSGFYDLQSVVTHEVGHFVDLADIAQAGCKFDPLAMTMCDQIGPNDSSRRSLEWGDKAGLRFAYPEKFMAVTPSDGGARQGMGWFTAGSDAAASNIDGDGAPDLVVAFVDDPGGENTIFYRVGWDLNGNNGGVAGGWTPIKTAVPTTATGARTGVGAFTAGLGLALGHFGGGGSPELVVTWVDAVPNGANRIFYRVGYDINAAGDASWWDPIREVPASFVGHETQGIDVCLSDFDGTFGPEMIFAWVDNPDADNTVRFLTAHNLFGDGTPNPTTGGWGSVVESMPGWTGIETSDLGIVCTDLDGGGVDMMVAWMDNPPGENHVRYRVARNIGFTGNGQWTPAPSQFVESTKSGPGGLLEWWGAETDGFGLASANVDGFNADEVIFVWTDDPSGNNFMHYRTEWNGAFDNHT